MVAFNSLWGNHPALESPPNIYPCSSSAGIRNFTSQCAIRLGVALNRSGVSLSGFPGAFCWHKHGTEHPLRVSDMARWLNSASAYFVGTAQIARRSASSNLSHANYAGKRGIIMWLNFWGTDNQGDHIDLWNGGRIAYGMLDYFSRSQEIHFWRMP